MSQLLSIFYARCFAQFCCSQKSFKMLFISYRLGGLPKVTLLVTGTVRILTQCGSKLCSPTQMPTQ